MSKYTNQLIHETSPYLLQHAHNPVNWYPWGEEVLGKARQEDKPILLSIGYSACHWCHVMEHESFEDEATARLMNAHFVNVKVDREERPDLDAIYMEAVQAMTGHGGWPMTVFLTPEGIPFYGGTYFPPEPRQGMPAFRQVLQAVAEAWRNRRAEIIAGASQIVGQLQPFAQLQPAPGDLTITILDRAHQTLKTQFDRRFGGFGRAPKFPQPMNLEFLLRIYHRTGDSDALSLVEQTLKAMAEGGIYDQLGGGFHRYSVDACWLVPHFEKMLYDNALLSQLYLHAYQATGKLFYHRVVEETLDYVLREMTSPEGGFYATQDADSEGEEGKFYVWTLEEVRTILGHEDAHLFTRYFDVSPEGNFEGKNILHVTRDLEIAAREFGVSSEQFQAVIQASRRKLLEARSQRVWPGRDEKVLTAWNGLMLRSLAEAGRVLDRADYLDAARRNAEFLLRHLRRDDLLLRTYKDGQARLNAYLEDYANLADGLLTLYETTFDLRWLEVAQTLADTLIAEFWDDGQGSFFTTGRSHEQLITRPKDFYDDATPSGNSVAAGVLLRLSVLTGEPDYQRYAVAVFQLLREIVTRAPGGFGHLLGALDFYLSTPKEIALIGDPDREDMRALLRVVYGRFLPNKVVALCRPEDTHPAELISLLADRPPLNDQATAYVCEHYTCQMPTTDPEELARQLG